MRGLTCKFFKEGRAGARIFDWGARHQNFPKFLVAATSASQKCPFLRIFGGQKVLTPPLELDWGRSPPPLPKLWLWRRGLHVRDIL